MNFSNKIWTKIWTKIWMKFEQKVEWNLNKKFNEIWTKSWMKFEQKVEWNLNKKLNEIWTKIWIKFDRKHQRWTIWRLKNVNECKICFIFPSLPRKMKGCQSYKVLLNFMKFGGRGGVGGEFVIFFSVICYRWYFKYFCFKGLVKGK
jgi:hypothetical protein